MLSAELLKKVKRIEITTRRVVDDVMTGRYRSHFKGQGVQFSEHRVYVPGDDVRHIDWKVSARTREPLVKKFEEERELTVLLIVDVSGSEQFGSATRLKSEVAAEVAGMLAYAASFTGDRVGLLLFAGEVERLVSPKKGRNHVLRIVRDVLSHQPRTRGTDLKGALEAAARVMKHSGVVFVVSDFMATDFKKPLSRLARKHDVVAIRVDDVRESEVPDVGHILLWDPESGPESGEGRLVNTGSWAFKQWMIEAKKKREAELAESMKGRIEQLRVQTKEDYGEALVRFFRARSRKRR